MAETFRHILNPRHKTGGYALPHVAAALVLLKLTLAAVAVFFAVHTVQDWRTQVKAARKAFHPTTGVVVPTAPAIKVIPAGGGSLPPSAGIDTRWFTGTDNQGGRETTTCEAHVFAKAVSDAVNKRDHTHSMLSPRLSFDDVVAAQGHPAQMIPTAPQWYVGPTRTKGMARNKYLSYGPHQIPASYAPYGVERAPSFINPHRHKLQVSETFLWGGQGAGAGGLQKFKQQIARGNPVIITLPMDYNAEQASWLTGYYTVPAAGDWHDFDHGLIYTRYQNNRRFGGETGWALCNNSWGPMYGVDEYGNFHPGHAGYVWVSYRELETQTYQALVVTVAPPTGTIVVGGGGSFYKSAHTRKDQFTPPYNPGLTAGGGGPWVRGVHYNNDIRSADISGIINDAAAAVTKQYGYPLSAVGLAATLATESNLIPAAPHYPIPGAGPCDYSGGISQFTVCTIKPYGVGDGSTSWANIQYVLNWENTHPVQMIYWAAQLLASDRAIACIDFYPLYVAYNAGAGAAPCGSSWWWNPTGLAGSNLTRNFIPWWNYANANWSTGTRSSALIPPKPRIFPLSNWNRAVVSYNHAHPRHRHPLVPYRYHGKLARVPSFWAFTPGVQSRCGSPVAHEVWWPQKRYRFERQQFARCVMYSKPTLRGDPVWIH